MVANVHAGVGTTVGDVTYRPMTWQDVDAVTEEFDRTWGPDDPAGGTPLSPLVSRHFVLHYLAPSTRADIAQCDGRFMGVALARVVGRPVLFTQAEAALREVDGQLERSGADGLQALHAAERWHRIEETMEEQTDLGATAHGELELFLVAGAARGHGVGGALWRRMNQYFASCGVNRFFLHTDESCDVGFYDHQGMDQLMVRRAADHPTDGEMGDLYLYAGAPTVGAGRHAVTEPIA